MSRCMILMMFGCAASAQLVAAADEKLLRNLENLCWQQGLAARDQEQNQVKAARYFYQAGLYAAASGDEQTAVESIHAGIGSASIIERCFLHDGTIDGVAFSADEKWICTWTREEHAAHVWSLTTGRLHQTLSHAGHVYAATFDAEGSRVLTSHESGLTLWKLGELKPVYELAGRNDGKSFGAPQGAAFFPDERRFFIWDNRTLRLELPGEPKQSFSMPMETYPQGVWISPDGLQALTWGDAGVAKLWRTEDGQPLRTWKHPGRVSHAVPLPEFKEFFTVAFDEKGDSSTGTLRKWSVRENDPVASVPLGQTPHRLVLHPDGIHLLTYGPENYHTKGANAVFLRSLATLEQVGEFVHETPIAGVALSPPEGNILASWSVDGAIKFWSFEDRKLLRTRRPAAKVHDVLFSPDGRLVAVWHELGRVELWKTPTTTIFMDPERPVAVFRHDGEIRGVRFIDGGERLLTWSSDHSVRVWNVRFGIVSDKVMSLGATGGRDLRLTWHQPGVAFFSAGENSPLRLWSLESRSMLHEWPKGNLLESNAANNTVLIRADAGSIQLWSPGEEEPRQTLAVDPKSYRFAVVDDGKKLVASTILESVLWSLDDGKFVRKFSTDSPFERQAVISADNRLVAIGRTGRARLWDIEKQDPQREWDFSNTVTELAVDAQGRCAVAWGNDTRESTKVHLWSLKDDSPPKSWRVTQFGDMKFEFSSDGTKLLGYFASAPGAWLWDVATGRELKKLHQGTSHAPDRRDSSYRFYRFHPSRPILLTSGGRPYATGSREQVWSLSDLAAPRAVRESGHFGFDKLAFLDDGMSITYAGKLQVHSLGRTTSPLVEVRGDTAGLGSILIAPDIGQVYAADLRRDLYKTAITAHRSVELPARILDFECRTGVTIDDQGNYRPLSVAEWNARNDSIPQQK